MKVATPDLTQARDIISSHLDNLSSTLHSHINKPLHDHPETAFKEVFAHDTISAFLESQGFTVQRRTYGLDTSLEACIGQQGRQVVFCAEYDALPEIGHACGHNLIATASIAAFLAAAKALKELQIPGRLRLLGTPAEEGFGGKAILVDAGAFDPPQDIAAAIMAHPMSSSSIGGDTSVAGLAGFKTCASHKFKVEFHGKTAHAAAEPWNGINAMDAAVSAYYNASLMRQQIRPDERIHHIIEVGGTVQNVIPDYTRMSWNVRAPTMARADALLKRVKACIEAGAAASGCTFNYIPSPTSMNLRANTTLCEAYAKDMKLFDRNIIALKEEPSGGSTDMGNVSHHVPSFHGTFVIPADDNVAIHNPAFAAAAATEEAHLEAIMCAKGMAMLALRVLVDSDLAQGAKDDFDRSDD